MSTTTGAPWELASGELRFVTDGTCRACNLEVHKLPSGRVLVICNDSLDDPRHGVGDVVERLAAIVCRRWSIDPYRLIWVERSYSETEPFAGPVFHRVQLVVARTLRGWSFVRPTRQIISVEDLAAMGLDMLLPATSLPEDLEPAQAQ